MPVFPAYLLLLVQDFMEDLPSAVKRTDMEDGMVKQLQTISRVLKKRPVRYLAKSKADKDAFEAWHRDEISRGADWFTWTDPYDNTPKSARIVGGKVDYKPQRKQLDRWVLSFTVETFF